LKARRQQRSPRRSGRFVALVVNGVKSRRRQVCVIDLEKPLRVQASFTILD
jgi:hypothetical protein